MRGEGELLVELGEIRRFHLTRGGLLIEDFRSPVFLVCSTPSSLTKEDCASEAFSKTPIRRFVILFRHAAPEIEESHGLPVPALIFVSGCVPALPLLNPYFNV